ncbi:EI24 domain-containing protein [Streptomyces pinistramenti]|uniref:EI24 domain-containing protein n=1 Tax=Streptomyces pinistramenti TaxID=2884812 RepID=UPI001D0997FA|nr:EI24 domain-containing protein [Streptomyces pinistramenti]MCB5907270.1 EI24 domain-containing protein [Streptomyces pinistramenti]
MRDLIAGMRYLGRGQRWVAGHGRWWGFGLIPALITLVLYAAVLTVLVLWSGDIAAWATPFADGWGAPWQGLLRGLFVAAGLLLSVLTFTAVTLLIGDPFYEELSEKVEESEGHCPRSPDRPLWREIWIALRDSVHVLLRAAPFGIALFVLGFVPFIGQTVIPAVGFCVSGFFLAVELTSVAMQRRDIPVRERLRLLRGRKALAVGFGTPLVLLFLVPFVAVVLMPGAVAGATLLARDLAPDEAEPSADGTDAGAPDRYGHPQASGPQYAPAAAGYARVPAAPGGGFGPPPSQFTPKEGPGQAPRRSAGPGPAGW